MISKTAILAFIPLLLLFTSGCKNDRSPEPQPLKVVYIQSLGDLIYENDLLTSMGDNIFRYDDRHRLSAAIRSRVDTSYSWFGGEESIRIREYYLQYGFIWEGAAVQGIKIDSTFSQSSSNDVPHWPSYSTNIPLVSFFHTGDKLDSIICHAPSELNGISRIIFEYDNKNRIIRKTLHGLTSRPPFSFPIRYIQIHSSFEYDDYNNPYHLLYRQLGTLLPELIFDNFSPNNPLKHTTFYKEGSLELNYETNYSYTYNARRYPTQMVTDPGYSHERSRIFKYQ